MDTGEAEAIASARLGGEHGPHFALRVRPGLARTKRRRVDLLCLLGLVLGGFPEEGAGHWIARSDSDCLENQFDTGLLTDFVGLGTLSTLHDQRTLVGPDVARLDWRVGS